MVYSNQFFPVPISNPKKEINVTTAALCYRSSPVDILSGIAFCSGTQHSKPYSHIIVQSYQRLVTDSFTNAIFSELNGHGLLPVSQITLSIPVLILTMIVNPTGHTCYLNFFYETMFKLCLTKGMGLEF